VMPALEHAGRGSAEMPMIMAVGVRSPFGDELDYVSGLVKARDCNGIIDRIIELWTTGQMLLLEMVQLKKHNCIGRKLPDPLSAHAVSSVQLHQN